MKKLIATLVCITLFAGMLIMPTAAAEYTGKIGTVICIGDVNFDGNIDSNDYAMVRAIATYQSSEDSLNWIKKRCADVNGDDVIDGLDAVEIDVFINLNPNYSWLPF